MQLKQVFDPSFFSVKNDAGEMSMSKEAKQNARAEQYERLLNIEFVWDPDHLSNKPQLEGPPILNTIDMVKKAISKMKSGKAAGPSGLEVIKLEFILKLKIKRNDWLLACTCPQATNHCTLI